MDSTGRSIKLVLDDIGCWSSLFNYAIIGFPFTVKLAFSLIIPIVDSIINLELDLLCSSISVFGLCFLSFLQMFSD